MEAVVRANDVPVVPGSPVVFFAPSIEGVVGPLRKLAAQLTLPAFCLQFTPDTPRDSIPNVAKSYIQVWLQPPIGDRSS